MKDKYQDNIYLRMPLNQARADARHGVWLARAALRRRDPKSADALDIGIDPDQQQKARVIEATAEFLKDQSQRKKKVGR